MNNDQLAGIREKLVKEIEELALSGSGDPVSRFQVILEMIRAGRGAGELFEKASDLLELVEDEEEKMDLMLDLVAEIDKKIAEPVSGQGLATPKPLSSDQDSV